MEGTFTHIDKETILRISDGDESAFTLLFHHYYIRLRPFVSRFLGDPGRAEEALQETFIRVWLHRDKLPEIDNIGAWLYTICSRVCLSEIRKDLTHRRYMKQFNPDNEPSPLTPAEATHLADISRMVNEAIAKMPSSRRRIYLMSREQGLKPAEIAEQLSLSVNTVRNTLVAALKNIKDHLAASGHLVGLLYFLSKIL